MEYRFGPSSIGDTANGIYILWKYPVGNCEAYTQLTNFMLHLAGISNATITGFGHTWSAALVEDGWIMIDSTNNIFAKSYDSYDAINLITFSANDNLICVIDDVTGVKLASYGKSIFDHPLESEIRIPDYISYIYNSAFLDYIKDDLCQVIMGTAGSYAEAYLKKNLPQYDTYTYENGMFRATCSQLPAPMLDPTGFTLSFEDEIRVNLYLDPIYCSGLNSKDMGLLVWDQHPGTPSLETAQEIFPGSNGFMVHTDGIPAKKMGDTRYYVGYAKLPSGEYIFTEVLAYSPKQYAYNMLGKSNVSNTQKALCVAMLNYGAAAQEYFRYNTDSLMNADLTDAQKALVTGYNAGLFAGPVAASDNKVVNFQKTGTGFFCTQTTISNSIII
jgi:hypothetical protein